MGGESERTSLRKGHLAWDPRDDGNYPGKGAASSQASQSLGFTSMDEMIHMGPAQSTLSFNNKEMNIAAGLCVRCARKMRNSGPLPCTGHGHTNGVSVTGSHAQGEDTTG